MNISEVKLIHFLNLYVRIQYMRCTFEYIQYMSSVLFTVFQTLPEDTTKKKFRTQKTTRTKYTYRQDRDHADNTFLWWTFLPTCTVLQWQGSRNIQIFLSFTNRHKKQEFAVLPNSQLHSLFLVRLNYIYVLTGCINTINSIDRSS